MSPIITWVERCWPRVQHVAPRPRIHHWPVAVKRVTRPVGRTVRRTAPVVAAKAAVPAKIAVGGLVCQMVPVVLGQGGAIAPVLPRQALPEYVPPYDLNTLQPGFGYGQGQGFAQGPLGSAFGSYGPGFGVPSQLVQIPVPTAMDLGLVPGIPPVVTTNPGPVAPPPTIPSTQVPSIEIPFKPVEVPEPGSLLILLPALLALWLVRRRSA